MSRQVKTNREKDLNVNELISKILKDKDLDISEFAIECKISPDTLKKAVIRNQLSKGLVAKIHDRFAVRKDYLKEGKEPIYEEKSTYVDLPSRKEKDPDEHIRILIKNLDRMGELNEYLLKELKRLQGG